MDQLAIQQMIIQQIDDRDHRLTQLDHPVGGGGPRQVQAKTLELLLLAIERQSIDVLGAGDMRQKRGRRIALGQDLRRLLGKRHMGFAAGAGVFQPDVAQHLNLGRNNVDLLGSFISNAFQHCPVLGADLLGVRQVMNDIDTGRSAAIGLRPGALRLWAGIVIALTGSVAWLTPSASLNSHS